MQCSMEVSAVVSIGQGLDFVLGRFLEFDVTINSLLYCHVCRLVVVVVYMCMSIYDNSTDAIALNEKSPQMRALIIVTTLG